MREIIQISVVLFPIRPPAFDGPYSLKVISTHDPEVEICESATKQSFPDVVLSISMYLPGQGCTVCIASLVRGSGAATQRFHAVCITIYKWVVRRPAHWQRTEKEEDTFNQSTLFARI